VLKDFGRDARLAKRIASGDGAAFAEFVDRYGPRIQALARRYAATNSDAEDLTQEIFLDLYRSIGSFRGSAALSTWAYRVALNHCLKHCNRRPAQGVEFDEALSGASAGDVADPVRGAVTGELKEKVHVALSDLTPEHRDVVILHELQDLTYSECAKILRIPVGTVKSRLFYAFRILRGSLAAYVLGDPCLPESSLGKATGAITETIS
jgi:RNA polymerase sigma-70 factor (ECF subfamily)